MSDPIADKVADRYRDVLATPPAETRDYASRRATAWIVAMVVAVVAAWAVIIVEIVVPALTAPIAPNPDDRPAVASFAPVPLGPGTRRPLDAALRTTRPLPLAHEADTTDLPATADLRRALQRVR